MGNEPNSTPGSASPRCACSAPEYKIEHVRDLLAVPEDRLDACLEELKDYLALAREMQELTKVVGEIVGADGSSTIGAFTWIDDGKHERTVRIQTKIEGPNEMRVR